MDFEKLAVIGRTAGLCAVGVCRADPFTEVALTLRQRKHDGLHAGMQFTYRNPDRSTDPSRLVPGAAALVVGALDFHRQGSDEPADGQPYGRVAAYAQHDHYRVLRHALESMAQPLRAAGHRAAVSADENWLVDRAAAQRAGLGWWGKNSNILVPGAGSLVVLGSIVTDAPIAAVDPEPVADGCGSCRQCLDGCPTSAIVAPGTIDARRCLAWLVQQEGVFPPEFRVALGDRIYGCDDCSDVCPPNRVRVRLTRRGNSAHHNGSEPPPDALEASDTGASVPVGDTSASDPVARAPSASEVGASVPVGDTIATDPVARAPSASDTGAWVPVLEMLDASDEELMHRYGRWYIPRRQARYLRRNALVVLGNIGNRSDPGVRAAVDRALAHPDPLVRAHAVWCARRLGLGLECLHGPDDPLVQEELCRTVPLRAA